MVVSGSVPQEGQIGDLASWKWCRYAWRGVWLMCNWARMLTWCLVSFVAIFMKFDIGDLGLKQDDLSYLGDVWNSFS